MSANASTMMASYVPWGTLFKNATPAYNNLMTQATLIKKRVGQKVLRHRCRQRHTITDVNSDSRILVPDCYIGEEFLVSLPKKENSTGDFCGPWFAGAIQAVFVASNVQWSSEGYSIHQWSSGRAQIYRFALLKHDETLLGGSLHLPLQWAEPEYTHIYKSIQSYKIYIHDLISTRDSNVGEKGNLLRIRDWAETEVGEHLLVSKLISLC